jgi:hypothetical protein
MPKYRLIYSSRCRRKQDEGKQFVPQDEFMSELPRNTNLTKIVLRDLTLENSDPTSSQRPDEMS